MKNAIMVVLMFVLVGCGCKSIYTEVIDQDFAGVQSYLAAGAGINEPDRWGMTPLLYAAYYGHPAMVQFLLDKGADINRINPRTGDTALLYAAYYGYVPVVHILLERGADVNIINKYGYNALEYARKYDWNRVEQKLLEKGAKPIY